MKIALIGEYSGFHTNLRDGLNELGHNVVSISDGDGFKNFERDINLKSNNKNKYLRVLDYIKKVGFDINYIKDYDIIQFINPIIPPFLNLNINKYFINKLINNNKSSFLVCAGDDALVWDYWESGNNENLRYSWIKGTIKDYIAENALPYWENENILLWNKELIKEVNGIIPIMYEYFRPYSQFIDKVRAIPIPINLDKIKFSENKVKNKLIIFHGLNRYFAKGTNYVEKAFDILKSKYPNDLELIIAGKLTYNEYTNIIKDTNVIIDQVLSYSMGMNGLNSLAMGKILLGGNEKENNDLLGYEFNPVINITPDVKTIVTSIERVLDEKHLIAEKSYESRQFVETYHNHVDVSQKYIDFWLKKL
ncbi:hypothetical protein [Elizabethkingia ursingii]|jgi:hypothetical protein|uniref:Glycosyl transferase family 1 n=1 Tax=Elizabethkingia ursingii TaxID=1756150 RepID=A0AAJ3TNP3_9FLAO|nr:hypothetical protein [Elizabethkingia ursingii]AQX08207.1 hypothetical protein BBD34_05910 [Elizabethkingia ursingii]MDR2229246.1 hypothetical protein [Flavobacteriaceae bacterium]OPB73437.1 hypothetical protein BAY32_10310 [Elizabethkingia ursingii]OPB86955.1 hypothetical protein BB021_10600 [Elizabethkingia ursingii]